MTYISKETINRKLTERWYCNNVDYKYMSTTCMRDRRVAKEMTKEFYEMYFPFFNFVNGFYKGPLNVNIYTDFFLYDIGYLINSTSRDYGFK